YRQVPPPLGEEGTVRLPAADGHPLPPPGRGHGHARVPVPVLHGAEVLTRQAAREYRPDPALTAAPTAPTAPATAAWPASHRPPAARPGGVRGRRAGPARGGRPVGRREPGAARHRPRARTRRPPPAGDPGDGGGRALRVRLRRGEGEPDRAGGGRRGGVRPHP